MSKANEIFINSKKLKEKSFEIKSKEALLNNYINYTVFDKKIDP